MFFSSSMTSTASWLPELTGSILSRTVYALGRASFKGSF
jgi:hypothetical protein